MTAAGSGAYESSTGRVLSCAEWGEQPHEPQEVCPICGHYALQHLVMGCDSCVRGEGRVSSRSTSDAEWLHELFAVPEQQMAQLPEWARPVVTPPQEQDR